MSLKKSTTILGIDPGYGIVGFGVIEMRDNHPFHVTHGVITTPAKMELIDRIKIITQDLQDIIIKYNPDAVVLEKLFFANNQKTAIDVGQARGAMLGVISTCNLPIIELTPLQVKQGITSYGKADKKQIQSMVQKILKLKSIPKPDDAADALAIAITGSGLVARVTR